MVRLPAGMVLGIWFAIQIFSSLAADPNSAGVAWFAHIGGFVAGMALIPFFRRRGVSLFHHAHGSRKWHRRL
jgi:membrane associated rhomboid family serine protease